MKPARDRHDITQKVQLNKRQAAMLSQLQEERCASASSVLRFALQKLWNDTIAERADAGRRSA
jgi:Arc/MetJ-type ribon-helix-helix transcriptional regulator